MTTNDAMTEKAAALTTCDHAMDEAMDYYRRAMSRGHVELAAKATKRFRYWLARKAEILAG
jgi:hypothetical protein